MQDKLGGIYKTLQVGWFEQVDCYDRLQRAEINSSFFEVEDSV